MELIAASGYRAFPPRLEGQDIFYPVLTFDYAQQIARDWNTKDPVSGFAGYVTAFEIDPEYAARFDAKIVGDVRHQELWVPAAELEEFNRHITGDIKVLEAFFGESFSGDRHRFKIFET